MAKAKSIFVCNECGYESNGWLGKCPACNQWNSFFEQKILNKKNSNTKAPQHQGRIIEFENIKTNNHKRMSTSIGELDRVLGGGVVKGSMILIGGEPGIGKSTLTMQLCGKVAEFAEVLYVSGEESAEQVKDRATRLSAITEVNSSNMLMLAENCFNIIEDAMNERHPAYLIIDSIQTMFCEELESAPGSVSQVREVTARLMRIAKSQGITIFLVGHVTKEGAIAGPRVLEHMVDTVLYFEGERFMTYRILRSVKNRFGSTNEIGIFEMTSEGLKQVINPSEMFISERPSGTSGTVVVSSLEGTRSLLIEVQALVSVSGNFNPRRTARGMDYNRMNMLLAVLEKKAFPEISRCDIYLNVVGGLAVDEPACDLGVLMAAASSYTNKPVNSNTVFIGEVGLTGEVRAVGQIEKRIMEASRLGFSTCIVPAGNSKGIKSCPEGVEIKLVSTINDALEWLD